MTGLSIMDARTVAIIAVQVLAAAISIATMKADIRWLKYQMKEHEKSDRDNFSDIRRRLGNLGG